MSVEAGVLGTEGEYCRRSEEEEVTVMFWEPFLEEA